MNIKPKKHLGQNFLLDNNISQKIIKILDCKNTETIMEIGPGMGALTIPLLDHCKFAYAIEIDYNLCNYLNAKNISKLKIINSDILKLESKYFEGIRYFVGNLPYNISSQIIIYLLKNLTSWKKMVFMVQSEMAERILAKKNTKSYGRISVIAQWLCDIEKKMHLSPNYFFPKPKIDSLILKFKFKKKIKKVNNEIFLVELIKKCFNQRRKTIKNNLKKIVNFSDQILINCKINTKKRPEELDFNDFINISNSFSKNKKIL